MNKLLSKKALIRIALGILIGVAFLFWVLYRIDAKIVWSLFDQMPLSKVLIAFSVYSVNIALRTIRWPLLIDCSLNIPRARAANALLIGYALNVLLPARLGEVYRAHHFGRRNGLSRTKILMSIVIERLLDGLTILVLAMIGLTGLIWYAGMPSLEVLLGVFSAALAFAVFVFVVLWYINVRRLPINLSRFPSMEARLQLVQESLRVIRGKQMIEASGLSIAIWALELATLWLVVDALGVSLSVGVALVLLGAVNLSTLIPTAPGFAGSYQASYVFIFIAMGLDPNVGVAASIVFIGYIVGPFVLLGLLVAAFLRAGHSKLIQESHAKSDAV